MANRLFMHRAFFFVIFLLFFFGVLESVQPKIYVAFYSFAQLFILELKVYVQEAKERADANVQIQNASKKLAKEAAGVGRKKGVALAKVSSVM